MQYDIKPEPMSNHKLSFIEMQLNLFAYYSVDNVKLIFSRYPDFVAPCLGVHPVQSLCPDRSATLEVSYLMF